MKRRRYCGETSLGTEGQLHLPSGAAIWLSAGKQNQLMRAVVEEFCARFVPEREVIFIKDVCRGSCAYLDEDHFRRFGISFKNVAKLPDLVVYSAQKNWLFLVEALGNRGPVNSNRLGELTKLFNNSRAYLVVVTAAFNRQTLSKQTEHIAWSTHAWVADEPNHMLHFNGGGLTPPKMS